MTDASIIVVENRRRGRATHLKAEPLVSGVFPSLTGVL
ncbi:hypothetical protein FHR87_002426 [Azomonas macrocytogenes]|uniref:Uncharacterized protein n=1 Tax=Azomonas macrocytogenes TaxID=69962 RepID=A0A839T6C8_AZOMA|nr:hypothetical protein [Azomonas macrocytogenes]